MSRWEPGAADRLRETALRLYVEQGYDQTTVAEIASAAGLTARTFFRHFGDKREVLFSGSTDLQAAMVAALLAVPPPASPMDAVAAALDASAGMLGTHRDYSRSRNQVIAAHAELRERELIKLAALAEALAGGLRDREVEEPAASLAAEAGIAVMRVAFDRWVADDEDRPLLEVMTDSLTWLREVTGS